MHLDLAALSFAAMTDIWMRPDIIAHSALLLSSFQRIVGRELMPSTGNAREDSQRLFDAPFALVSHGTQTDPILNYGNATALRLWEVDFNTLTRMPSRLTAQPMLREERQRLMERASAKGFIDDYSGIRISSTGKLFRIENVILWNVVDDKGERHGQAAVFNSWSDVAETE